MRKISKGHLVFHQLSPSHPAVKVSMPNHTIITELSDEVG